MKNLEAYDAYLMDKKKLQQKGNDIYSLKDRIIRCKTWDD